MQSPRAKEEIRTNLIQSSRSVAYKNKEDKRREKNDETSDSLNPSTLTLYGTAAKREFILTSR